MDLRQEIALDIAAALSKSHSKKNYQADYQIYAKFRYCSRYGLSQKFMG